MSGTLIISLDCEGKWGMADRIDSEIDSIFTSKALLLSYKSLLKVLNEREIPATFAFVGMFALSYSEGRRWHKSLTNVSLKNGQRWLDTYFQQIVGQCEGWHLPEAVDLVRKSGRHEVASHGFSHLPLLEKTITKEIAKKEFYYARSSMKELGIDALTYVFPRNQVAYLPFLFDAGFKGYRNARFAAGNASLLSGMLDELNVFSKADFHTFKMDGSCCKNVAIDIPAGQFLNWRYGKRKAIPKAVTVKKWKSILTDAAVNSKVAHLWLHPHNIITAPETIEIFESVLEYARILRDDDRINITSQSEYCNSMRARKILGSTTALI